MTDSQTYLDLVQLYSQYAAAVDEAHDGPEPMASFFLFKDDSFTFLMRVLKNMNRCFFLFPYA